MDNNKYTPVTVNNVGEEDENKYSCGLNFSLPLISYEGFSLEL